MTGKVDLGWLPAVVRRDVAGELSRVGQFHVGGAWARSGLGAALVVGMVEVEHGPADVILQLLDELIQTAETRGMTARESMTGFYLLVELGAGWPEAVEEAARVHRARLASGA